MLLITCTYITVEKNWRYSSIDEKFSCSFDAFLTFIEVKVRVLMNVCLMFVCCLFVCLLYRLFMLYIPSADFRCFFT